MAARRNNEGTTSSVGAHTMHQRQPHIPSGTGADASAFTGFSLSTLNFEPIPALTVKQKQSMLDMPSNGSMLQQLTKAYIRYCKISGLKPKKTDAKLNDALQIRQLYEMMYEVVSSQDNRLQLNIEMLDGKYWFTAYRHIGAQDYTVYAFPTRALAIANKQHPALYKALAPFAAWVYTVANFSDWENSGYFDYMIQWFTERLDEEISEAEEANAEDKKYYNSRIKRSYKVLEPYTKNGIGQWYLNIVRNPSIPIEQLQDVLNAYHPKGTLQKDILKWMKEGVGLLNSPDAVSLMNLQYDDESSATGDEPLTLDKIFLFNWQDDDVFEEYLASISNDSNEFGCMSPVQFHVINSKTTEVYKANEWPMQFLEWFDKGVAFINRYIDKHDGKYEPAN